MKASKLFEQMSERFVPVQGRQENPRMTPALKLFSEGDTMEATIVEAFEEGDETLREYGHRSPFRAIFVGTDMDALYESAMDFAEGPDGGVPGIGELGAQGMALSGNHERKIDQHLDHMFEDFEPHTSVLAFASAYPLTAVMITMDDEDAAAGLADYFAFLYEGYADVYEE